jgi:hypothetical protein
MHVDSEDTIILGGELVCQKIVALVSEVLNEDAELGVASLIFRNDGYPEGALGMAYPDTHSVAINLAKIWDSSIEIASSGKYDLSLRGILWINLLSTVLHDIYHIYAANIDRNAFESMDDKDKEDEADDWAKQKLVELAVKFDIEPPTMHEMGWFAGKLMELMNSDAVNEEWLGKHLEMMENGLLYQDKTTEIHTFREYLRRTMDEKYVKEADWDKISVVDMIINHEDGSTEFASGETVEKPEVKDEPDVVVLPENYDTSVEQDEKEEAAVEAAMAVANAVGAKDADSATGETGETVAADTVEAPTAEATPTTQVADNLFPSLDDHVQPAEMPTESAKTPQGDNLDMPIATDQVPLPANVMAEQQMYANAANVTMPTKSEPRTYPSNNIPDDKLVVILREIYQRCYHAIFTKCDRQLNSDQGFASPGGVLTPVQIGDILERHGVKDLVISYDTLNGAGQKTAEEFQGYVRGTIMSKTQLPAFDLHLNINGRGVNRRMVPQNPSKMKNGQYTQSAQEARMGHAICWIIDRDVPQGGKAFIAKIKDNQYEVL